MSNSTLELSLLMAAYMLYSPSLPSIEIFGLYMMVLVGILGYAISYMMRYKAFRIWLNRYF